MRVPDLRLRKPHTLTKSLTRMSISDCFGTTRASDTSVAGSRVGGAGAARARVRIGSLGPQKGLELGALWLTARNGSRFSADWCRTIPRLPWRARFLQ